MAHKKRRHFAEPDNQRKAAAEAVCVALESYPQLWLRRHHARGTLLRDELEQGLLQRRVPRIPMALRRDAAEPVVRVHVVLDRRLQRARRRPSARRSLQQHLVHRNVGLWRDTTRRQRPARGKGSLPSERGERGRGQCGERAASRACRWRQRFDARSQSHPSRATGLCELRDQASCRACWPGGSVQRFTCGPRVSVCVRVVCCRLSFSRPSSHGRFGGIAPCSAMAILAMILAVDSGWKMTAGPFLRREHRSVQSTTAERAAAAATASSPPHNRCSRISSTSARDSSHFWEGVRVLCGPVTL